MSIGYRIRQARKAARMSQRDLAGETGVSAMAVSKYERDLNTPSSGVLIHLAEALSVPAEYFFRPEKVRVVAPSYRKHAYLGAKDEDAIIARIEEALERYYDVESLFPDEQNALSFERVVSTLEEVENAADALRDAWQLGLSPIENLTEVFEEHGLKIVPIEGFDGFDACTFESNGVPVIALRCDAPGDRQRFNLAHELGHLVLGIAEKLDEERAANRFAGAFLVPGDAAEQELGLKRKALSYSELYLLKHKYGMSMQAWIYRAKDLGIITQSAARAHFAEFRRMGWYKQEPGDPLAPEEPRRFERLVHRALAEDFISRSRAEELLKIPIGELWPEVIDFYAPVIVDSGN